MLTKKVLSLALALSVTSIGMPRWAVSSTSTQARPSLQELVQKSYLEVLEIAPKLNISAASIEQFKKALNNEKEAAKNRAKARQEDLKKQIRQATDELAQLNKMASRDTPEMAERRRGIHCQIQGLQKKLARIEIEREQGLNVLYDNKLAKLDLLREWPAAKAEIDQTIASGKARQRKFGDAEDIGFRDVGKGQEKDIKRGEEAVKQLERYGLLPPEIKDEAVNAYIVNLAQAIGRNSDLQVPLHIKVLRTKEINAFALPGGFLYVNSGLILKAETESELAGVIAHEIAHVAARHSARLMKRATIAGIIYQAAQIAALIFTGGAVGIGTYYALQYGFYGLGTVLSLVLLGVSREFETEADQLGTQYLWKAGYDPSGFINFFDKMASEKGYIKSSSFFRTHPAFYNRIVETFREIAFLPPKEEYMIDSPEFQQIKERLAKVVEEDKKKDPRTPTLKRELECPEEEEEEPTETLVPAKTR